MHEKNSTILNDESNNNTKDILISKNWINQGILLYSNNVDDIDIRTNTNNLAVQVEVEKAKLRYYDKFVKILIEDEFEYGMTSRSEIILSRILENNYLIGKEILSDIFTKKYSNKEMIISLLRVISHFEYNVLAPQGMMIVASCFSNKDPEIIECAIRCCENWNNREILGILKNVDCRIDWLNNYLSEVINNIEKDN